MAANPQPRRINFASIKNPLDFPDFLEVQLKSFRDFFQLDTATESRRSEGLYRVFNENFPIADTRNNFVLEFLDYYVDPPKYTIEECFSRGLTYSVPLKAKLKLSCTDPDHEDFSTVVQDVFLGYIPYMTESGASGRLPAPPLAWGFLWDEHAHQRLSAVLRTYHPLQGLLDRVRNRHQQCHVCLHRS